MLTFDFSTFPTLETERLRLRRLKTSDVHEVFALRSDPKSMQYIPRPLAKNLDDALAHIALITENIDKNTGINWAVALKETDKLVGIMGFHRTEPENFRAEIGYMVLPEVYGSGIASEAVAKIVEYGFEMMQLHSIEAVIDPANVASARVLEKNRFTKEAHLRQNEFHNGRFIDTVIYCRLKTD